MRTPEEKKSSTGCSFAIDSHLLQATNLRVVFSLYLSPTQHGFFARIPCQANGSAPPRAFQPTETLTVTDARTVLIKRETGEKKRTSPTPHPSLRLSCFIWRRVVASVPAKDARAKERLVNAAAVLKKLLRSTIEKLNREQSRL